MNKDKRKKKLILLLILVLTVSIGYAAIATTLKINGTSQVKSARWNIYWSNPVVTTGSVTNTLPTLTESNTIATYTVTLNEPGDFYEFTIDATNAGSINAKIKENGVINGIYEADETTTRALPSYVGYSVTYSDGTAVAPGDILRAANGNTPTTVTYKVKVWYKQDIGISDINNAESDVVLKLRFQIEYVQADPSDLPVVTGAATIKSKASTTTSTLEAVAISHPATSQTAALTDYRYMGANPNNHIYFNCDNYSSQTAQTCESWRIIGVTSDDRIKIIREDSIDDAAWDYDSVNDLYENDWENSTLKATLNGEYLNSNLAFLNDTKVTTEGNKRTIRTTRNNYLEGEERSTFERNGIKNSTTKNLIQPSTRYLGGWTTNSVTPAEAYSYERGNVGGYRNGTEGAASTSISNTYVGLMYPSDYGYASSGCYNNDTDIGSYHDSTCTDSNWLYLGSYEWLLSPGTDNSYSAFGVDGVGYVSHYSVNDSPAVRPTVYLKSNIVLEGTGTGADPYKIVQ